MEAEQCGSEPHARGLSYSPRCISDGRYVCCVPHFWHAAVLLSAGGNGLFLRPALHRAGLPPLCRFCNTQKKIRPAPASRLTSSVASFASASRQASHLLSSRVAALWHSFGVCPRLVHGHPHLFSLIYELRLSQLIGSPAWA